MNYRDLQEENYINQTGGIPQQTQNHLDYLLQQQRSQNPYNPLMTSSGPVFQTPQVVQSPASGSRGFGESQYDREGIGLNPEEFNHIDDLRARNQSGLDQLANSIAKGTVLAGTTFLDGTLGMLYGISAAVDKGEWSGLWDNEVSNTLHDVNQQMEDYFQNYLTDEAKRNEAKGQWYKNMGTVNWWAENVVKNAGFMVGAYYSGLGWSKLLGALGKGLQAAKSAPGFIQSAGTSLQKGFARSAMGVFTSAVNEGRIEANNNSTDAFNIKAGQLENAFTQEQSEIANNPYMTDEEKYELIDELERTKAQRFQELDEMRKNMGTADMFMNLPILMVSEAIAWGRAFAGGSKAVLKANVKGFGTKHVGDNVSKIGMAAKGLGRGVSEGMEEMNQAAASNISGYRMMPGDSPDAWHQALIDPESNLKTMDTYNSILQSFKDTYGKSSSWQEFVAGAIPGLGGQVTIGRSNNSSPETWLGRGQLIGLTGGIGGSIYGDIMQNRINNEYAEYMNKYFGKRQKQLQEIARAISFNDGAEVAALDLNTFELKNQEDNDFIAAVSRFNAAGRLSELQESLTQPIDDVLEETEKGNLEPLTTFVTSTVNPETRTSPWIKDFSAKDDSELQTKVAEAINNPKQRKYIIDKLKKKKDFINDSIENYSRIREAYSQQFPMLHDEYLDELAWLSWKSTRFSDRAKELADNNKELFKRIKNNISRSKEEAIKKRDAFIQAHPDPTSLTAEQKEQSKELRIDVDSLEYNEDFIDMLLQNKVNDLGLEFRASRQSVRQFLTDGEIDEQMRKSGAAENDIIAFKENVWELQKLIDMRDEFKKRLAKYIQQSYTEKKSSPQEQAQSVQDRMDEAHEEQEVKRDVQQEMQRTLKYQDEIQAIGSYQDYLQALEDHKDDQEWIQEAEETSPYAEMKVAHKLATEKIRDDIQKRQAQNMPPTPIDPVILNYIDKAFNAAQTVDEALDINNPVYQDIENLGDYIFSPINGRKRTREETHQIVIDKIKKELDNAKQALAQKKKTTPSVKVQPKQQSGTGNPNKNNGRRTKKQQYEDIDDFEAEFNKVKGQKGTQLRSQADKSSPTNKEKSKPKYDEPTKTLAKKLTAALDVIFNDPNNLPKYKSDIIKTLQKTVIDKESKKGNYNLEQFIGEYLTSKGISIPEAWKLNYTPDTSDSARVTYDALDAVDNPDTEWIKEHKMQQGQGKANISKRSYLRSNTTQYAIYAQAKEKVVGHPIRYSEMLKDVLISKGYTDEEIANSSEYKRQVAVEQYLERTGAYERVNSGFVHAGKNPTEIFFTIDPALNEQAGDTVILMVDKDGNILGDMPTNDQYYEGLPEVIDAIKKEWDAAGKPGLDAQWRFSRTTKVAQVLNGRPLYTNDYRTIKDIKGNDSKIVYGVVRGSTVTTGIEEIDNNGQVQEPLNLKSGTPVICIPNGNYGGQGGFTTVPIYVPNFNPENEKLMNTQLGKVIMNNIAAVAKAKNLDELKKAVQNLSRNLYLPDYDFYLLVDQNGKMKRMSSGTQGEPTYLGISFVQKGKYQSSGDHIKLNEDDTVELIAQRLSGAMIRLSRYRMNVAPESSYDLDYRALYDEAFETNLPADTRHTVNNWFICDPVSLEGEHPKAEKIASLGVNPGGTTFRGVKVTLHGSEYRVDIDNEYAVTDEDNVPIQDTGEGIVEEVKARAQAYKEYTLTGKKPVQKKGGRKVYETNWGTIDAETLKFTPIQKKSAPAAVLDDEMDLEAGLAALQGQKGASLKGSQMKSKPKPEVKVEEQPAADEEPDLENQNPISQAPETPSPVSQEPETPSNVQPVHNEEQPPTPQESKPIETQPDTPAVDDERAKRNRRRGGGGKRQFRVATTLNPKNTIDVQKELNWLEKRLPKFGNFVRLRTGLIENRAWGAFENGIITLSTNAATGTTYHEAFHAVSQTLLSPEEKKIIFDAARERFGNLSDVELEEKLAEDFREYVQYEESGLMGKLRHIWRQLKHMIDTLFGNKDVLDRLYYDINNSNYADRIPQSEAQQYQNIEAYHKAKFMYANLTAEQRAYLYDNGISSRLYNTMTLDEKEILFYCM